MSIRYGVRNGHDEARFSEMPAFGADGLLDREQIETVADYVLSLSGGPSATEEGAEIYAENCAACHGEAGGGIRELGAPSPRDRFLLPFNRSVVRHADDQASIVAQITKPQHGVMPVWDGRLDDTTIKMLTVYVHGLGGGE